MIKVDIQIPLGTEVSFIVKSISLSLSDTYLSLASLILSGLLYNKMKVNTANTYFLNLASLRYIDVFFNSEVIFLDKHSIQ